MKDRGKGNEIKCPFMFMPSPLVHMPILPVGYMLYKHKGDLPDAPDRRLNKISKLYWKYNFHLKHTAFRIQLSMIFYLWGPCLAES